MDFKVAGDGEGVTAFQTYMKVSDRLSWGSHRALAGLDRVQAGLERGERVSGRVWTGLNMDFQGGGKC